MQDEGSKGVVGSLPSLQGTGHGETLGLASQLEERVVQDFVRRKKDILNVNPSVTGKYSDEELHMKEFIRPFRRGVGGLFKSRWTDFRVTERRMNDDSLAVLSNISAPPEGPRKAFIGFVLFKIGRDTLELIQQMAAVLNVPTSAFSFAGLKDRSGVTQQEMAVDAAHVSPRQLLGLNNGRALPRALVGNLRWRERPMHPGEHAGNVFSILLRHVEARPYRPPHGSLSHLSVPRSAPRPERSCFTPAT